MFLLDPHDEPSQEELEAAAEMFEQLANDTFYAKQRDALIETFGNSPRSLFMPERTDDEKQ